jgi:hypothetical protein
MSDDIKVQALAKILEVSEDSISEVYGDVYESEEAPGEYLVLTDEEADQAWDEELDRYLDECVLPEVPDRWRNYFDREAWKRDARHDSRGHSLSGYDGREQEIKIGDEWIYVYRVN